MSLLVLHAAIAQSDLEIKHLRRTQASGLLVFGPTVEPEGLSIAYSINGVRLEKRRPAAQVPIALGSRSGGTRMRRAPFWLCL
jgi:hypothetical protein